MKVSAVILAGGFGKRLKPITDEIPKILVEINGKPILYWQIRWLKNYSIEDFILLVGYKKEKIVEYLGDGSKFGIKVTYVYEEEPLGTGGAVKNAEKILRNYKYFLLINGDILTNLDPAKLLLSLKDNTFLGFIAAVQLRSPYGIIEFENDRIISFVEKPIIKDYWINAGVYALKLESLKYFPEKGDLERTTFPEMAKNNLLGVVRYENVFWKSIDTYKDIEEASQLLKCINF